MATSRKVNPLKVLAPLIILLMLIVFALAVIKLTLNGTGTSTPSFKLESQSLLPDFTLTQLDGKIIQSKLINGKVFLINFWATWCDSCMEEMGSLVKLRESYKDKGFEILGINLDENPEGIVPRIAKQYGIEFPIFKDTDGKLGELFDVRAIPLTVIINKKREVLFVKDGEQDWNAPEIRSELEQWLAR